MRRVAILMSTYNGGEKIKSQAESILNQKDVNICLLIRDDGSSQATKDVLTELERDNPEKVKVFFCKNNGWKQSFIELLFLANDADYYGFSDQDDVWMEEKVISCINKMETDDYDGVKLCHCNAICTNENLTPRNEQEKRIPSPPSHKVAFATEYFQGCGMIWNREAMRLLQKYKPKDKNISHDYWVGLICYLFGKIYFCEEPQFYHIRYEDSCSSDGNVLKGRMRRVKDLLSGKNAYMNPATDLLAGYDEYLDEDDRLFLTAMRDYKSQGECKKKILHDKEFSRPSKFSTLLLRLSIIFNRY